MLSKIKALLKGGQKLYTKNATTQGLVFIERQDWYRTMENLFTILQVDLYRYIAYITKNPCTHKM